MSECYGCGKAHPNEPCDNTAGDAVMVILGLGVPLLVFVVLMGAKLLDNLGVL